MWPSHLSHWCGLGLRKIGDPAHSAKCDRAVSPSFDQITRETTTAAERVCKLNFIELVGQK